jgi:hypothetical protein
MVCQGTTVNFTTSAAGGTWSNNPVTLATISTSGDVTGLLPGTDTLFYSVTNSCGTSVANKVITIGVLPYAGVISGADSLAAGFTTTYTSSVTGGAWSSSNTALATINTTGSSGGMAPGVDTIRYSFTNSCGTDVAIKSVTVTLNAGVISGPNAVCLTGGPITLTSTIGGGTWLSGASAIATINTTTGVVTGVSTGTANITYSYGLARSYYTVTAQATGVAGITGGTTTPCPGATTTYTNTTVGGTWSSVTGRVTVSSTGVVTAITTGADTIRYTVVNSCGTFVASRSVAVQGPTQPLAIGGSGAAICPGATRANTNSTAGGVWSLAGTGIATLSTTTGASVTVTGVAGGVDTLKYTLTNACGLQGISRSVVTVNPAANAGTISGPTTVAIAGGGSITLTTTGNSGAGTWSHTAATVASLSSSGTTATLRGRATGVDTVKFTVSNSCGTSIARYTITVTAAKPMAGAIETPAVVNVYPNPSTGILTIAASELIGHVYVTDLTGKLVTEAVGNDNKLDIDLSAYASGTYLLRIATASGVQMVKVVKE